MSACARGRRAGGNAARNRLARARTAAGGEEVGNRLRAKGEEEDEVEEGELVADKHVQREARLHDAARLRLGALPGRRLVGAAVRAVGRRPQGKRALAGSAAHKALRVRLRARNCAPGCQLR